MKVRVQPVLRLADDDDLLPDRKIKVFCSIQIPGHPKRWAAVMTFRKISLDLV